jgi:hypothetical protein
MVQCRMNTLADWIKEKNKFDNVAMIRLVYKGISYDYSKWKISGQNIFFYDDELKATHVLWTTENIKKIDDVHVIINPDTDPKYTVALELFYGGAIL